MKQKHLIVKSSREIFMALEMNCGLCPSGERKRPWKYHVIEIEVFNFMHIVYKIKIKFTSHFSQKVSWIHFSIINICFWKKKFHCFFPHSFFFSVHTIKRLCEQREREIPGCIFDTVWKLKFVPMTSQSLREKYSNDTKIS